MKTIPDRYGESYRAEYGKHYQEECAERVDKQGGGSEQQFQYLPHEVPHVFLQVVHAPFDIHPAHRGNILSTPSEFVNLLVELFVADQIGGFGIAHHGFIFQLVLHLTVLVHVHRLCFQHTVRSLYDGTQYAVNRAEYNRGEEQDADTDGERSEHRVHVDGFGSCEGLPYTGGDVNQRSQSGYPFCHPCHVGAEGHHFHIEILQYLMQVTEIGG